VRPRIYAQYEADLSIPWVYARQVDFADKLDRRWLVGVVIAAVHLQRIDSVLVHALVGIVSVLNISRYPGKKGLAIRVGGPGLSRSSST
jgi:hypothetical protein